MPTTIQMELTSWQLDADLNKITGVVEYDLFSVYKKGSIFMGTFRELEQRDKYFICKYTRTGVVVRNVICFVSFSLNKEGRIDVPNQVIKSFKSQLLGVL